MLKKYRVTLMAEERVEPGALISRGKADARKLAHARVLLLTDEAPGGTGRTDYEIASALGTSTRTAERVRQRFVEEGLGSALLPKPSKRILRPLLRRRAGGPRDRPGLLAAAAGEAAMGVAAAGRAGGRAGLRRVDLARGRAPDPQKTS